MADVLEVCGFKQNPFRTVPQNEMAGIDWAGDQEFMKSLKQSARSAQVGNIGTTEFVVVQGEFGSGKTNALKYLGNYLKEDGELIAYLQRPSTTDKPTWHALVRSVFRQSFVRDDLVERMELIQKWASKEAAVRARSEVTDDDFNQLVQLQEEKLKQIAAEILPESPGFFLLLVDMADPNLSKRDSNWNYLTGSAAPGDLKKVAEEYDLPAGGLGTDYDASLLFSYFVRVLTHPNEGSPATKAVYILIDEMEGLYEMPAASQQSLRGGMRMLIDACTEHLFIALAASGSDASEMWGILDNPLMQRISRNVMTLRALNDDEAEAFMIEIMKLKRLDDFTKGESWPFEGDALARFVELCPPPKTPRKLLQSAQRMVLQKHADDVAAGQGLTEEDSQQFTDWAASS